MATKETVFVSTNVNPTNSDQVNGRVTTVSFQLQSGSSLPPTGAVLVGVNFDFTNLNVYTSSSPRLDTSFGSIYLSATSGSQSAAMSGAKSSILSFDGGTMDFIVQSTRSAGSNVLNFKAGCTVTMTIRWEARTASTGSLDTTQGVRGQQITLSISAVDSSFTHAIKWVRSSGYASETTLGAGVTSYTLNIPENWPVGAATVSLTTYLNGSQVGSTQTYNWTVVVDGSKTFPTAGTLTPSLVQDARIPTGWNVYVQGFSKVKLTLSGHTAGTSATITNIELSIGELRQSDASKAEFTTPALTETGSLTPKAKVTNSFNNEASVNGNSITVHPYESPKVVNLLAYRCLANGTPNDYGTYIAVKATVSISSVNNLNDIVTLQAQYHKLGETTWTTGVDLNNDETAIIGGNLSTNGQYEIRIFIADSIQNKSGTFTTKTSLVLTSECVLFFRDGGLNVSVGTEGTRENAMELNANWHFWRGDTDWTDLVEGVRDVAHGGTGANNAATALSNLGAAPSSHSHKAGDITSGSLPVARGGTGAGDASTARSNLGITPGNIGAAASDHEHNANKITAGTLAAARLPFKVQYGTVTLSGASWSTVSLSGFSSTPMVLVAYTDDAASSGLNALKTRNRAASKFEVCMAGSGSGSRTVCWLAIGT